MTGPSGQADRAFPDAETLAVCERFSLWLRQGGGLDVRGRPVPSGDVSGLDFNGFAEYVPGMDLRHLDWGIYARTREFHVRRFADEGAGLLAVLLDASGSMGVGSPPKWRLARQLAAVLVFAALREVHQVLLGVLQDERIHALPVTGGLDFASVCFRFLASFEPRGSTRLGAALGDLPVGGARGEAVLVSDFLDPHGPSRALDVLSAQGFRVDLCRLTAAGELDLPAAGAVYDPEGAGHRVVPSDAHARRRIETAVADHRAELEQAAARRGAALLDLDAATPLAAALESYFRRVASARRGRSR